MSATFQARSLHERLARRSSLNLPPQSHNKYIGKQSLKVNNGKKQQDDDCSNCTASQDNKENEDDKCSFAAEVSFRTRVCIDTDDDQDDDDDDDNDDDDAEDDDNDGNNCGDKNTSCSDACDPLTESKAKSKCRGDDRRKKVYFLGQREQFVSLPESISELRELMVSSVRRLGGAELLPVQFSCSQSAELLVSRCQQIELRIFPSSVCSGNRRAVANNCCDGQKCYVCCDGSKREVVSCTNKKLRDFEQQEGQLLESISQLVEIMNCGSGNSGTTKNNKLGQHSRQTNSLARNKCCFVCIQFCFANDNCRQLTAARHLLAKISALRGAVVALRCSLCKSLLCCSGKRRFCCAKCSLCVCAKCSQIVDCELNENGLRICKDSSAKQTTHLLTQKQNNTSNGKTATRNVKNLGFRSILARAIQTNKTQIVVKSMSPNLRSTTTLKSTASSTYSTSVSSWSSSTSTSTSTPLQVSTHSTIPEKSTTTSLLDESEVLSANNKPQISSGVTIHSNEAQQDKKPNSSEQEICYTTTKNKPRQLMLLQVLEGESGERLSKSQIDLRTSEREEHNPSSAAVAAVAIRAGEADAVTSKSSVTSTKHIIPSRDVGSSGCPVESTSNQQSHDTKITSLDKLVNADKIYLHQQTSQAHHLELSTSLASSTGRSSTLELNLDAELEKLYRFRRAKTSHQFVDGKDSLALIKVDKNQSLKCAACFKSLHVVFTNDGIIDESPISAEETIACSDCKLLVHLSCKSLVSKHCIGGSFIARLAARRHSRQLACQAKRPDKVTFSEQVQQTSELPSDIRDFDEDRKCLDSSSSLSNSSTCSCDSDQYPTPRVPSESSNQLSKACSNLAITAPSHEGYLEMRTLHDEFAGEKRLATQKYWQLQSDMILIFDDHLKQNKVSEFFVFDIEKLLTVEELLNSSTVEINNELNMEQAYNLEVDRREQCDNDKVANDQCSSPSSCQNIKEIDNSSKRDEDECQFVLVMKYGPAQLLAAQSVDESLKWRNTLTASIEHYNRLQQQVHSTPARQQPTTSMKRTMFCRKFDTSIDRSKQIKDEIKERQAKILVDPKRVMDYLLFGKYLMNPSPAGGFLELGSGQFGIVYAGLVRFKQISDGLFSGRPVAIKVVLKARFELEQRRRLRAEGDILRALKHPGIVELLEVRETEQRVYVVTERLNGDMLEMIVNSSEKRLNERITKFLTIQILEALRYLHSQRIAHCDLKPENVLLVDKLSEFSLPQVKLCDFGFAKIIDDNDFRRSLVGTPAYLAPEVISGRQYNRSVDLWSVGVVVYVALSGEFPFNENQSIAEQISSSNFMYPQRQWAQVSRLARSFIDCMLKIKSERRLSASKAQLHEWFQVSIQLLSSESVR